MFAAHLDDLITEPEHSGWLRNLLKGALL